MLRFTLLPVLSALALVACQAQPSDANPIDSGAAVDEPTVPAQPAASSPSEPALAVETVREPIQLPMKLEGKAAARSLSQGFLATWGQVPSVNVDRPSGRVTFRTGDFAYLGDGRVLFAAYGDAAAAGGKGVIAHRYLTRGPDVLEAGPGDILFVEGGLGTAGQAGWIIRHDLMSDPVMMIENAGPWGDYSCIGADLIALTASGPVRLLPGDRRVRPLPNPDNLPLC